MGDGDTPTLMAANADKKAAATKLSTTKAPETIPIRASAQCDYRPIPQCVVDVTPEASSPSVGPAQSIFNPAAAVKHASV